MGVETRKVDGVLGVLGDQEEDRYRFIDTLKLFNSLNLEKGSKILDVGTWKGHLSVAISELGYLSYGVDKTEDFCRDLLKYGVEVVPCDIENEEIPFDDRFFDCVLFTEVLEHIHPRTVLQVFSEIFRVLKKDGILLVTTVNQASLQNIVRIMFGRKILFHHDHVREYVMPEIIENLKLFDFEVLRTMFLLSFDRPRKYASFPVNFFRCLMYPVKFLIPSFRSLIFVEARAR